MLYEYITIVLVLVSLLYSRQYYCSRFMRWFVYSSRTRAMNACASSNEHAWIMIAINVEAHI